MKRDTMNYGLVGLFVLTTVLVLLVVLYRMSGRSGPTDTYYLELLNVAGLKFGTQVAYEGYRIGEVQSISPENGAQGTRYRVVLGVQQDWRIPEDSRAEIVTSGLISAMSINIVEGKSETLLQPGAEISSQPRASMLSDINGAAREFTALSRDQIAPMLTTINQRINDVANELVALRREDVSPMLSDINTRLDEDVFARSAATLDRLERILAALEEVFNEENLGRIDTALVNVATATAGLDQLMSGLDETQAGLGELIEDLDGVVERSAPRIEATLGHLESTGANLDYSARSVANEIDGIMQNLATTARNMNEFSRAIRDNPSRVLRGSSNAEEGR